MRKWAYWGVILAALLLAANWRSVLSQLQDLGVWPAIEGRFRSGGRPLR